MFERYLRNRWKSPAAARCIWLVDRWYSLNITADAAHMQTSFFSTYLFNESRENATHIHDYIYLSILWYPIGIIAHNNITNSAICYIATCNRNENCTLCAWCVFKTCSAPLLNLNALQHCCEWSAIASRNLCRKSKSLEATTTITQRKHIETVSWSEAVVKCK